MTWFRLDDGWLMHPKIRAIGKDARCLWLAGGLHCASQLTDGRIDKHYLPVLAIQADVKSSCHQRLVEQGLWIDNGDHWQMHDYADYQMTRDDYEAERERKSKAGKASAKKRWQRDSNSSTAVITAVTQTVQQAASEKTCPQPNPTQPNPIEVLQVPTTTSLAVAPDGGGGYDERIIEAATLAAKADYARRDIRSVEHPKRYMASVRKNTISRDGTRCAAWIESNPDATPIDIAINVLGLDEWDIARASSIPEAI